MRTVAVVNVRMESTRLPGKALTDIGGKPLLRRLLDRLELVRGLDEVVVATSTSASNDVIASFCVKQDAACFRGSEDDVLARTLGALQSVDAEIGVVVYGDGPLIDPDIVDRIIETFFSSDPAYDFVGNDLKTTYPPGMEVEAFSVRALEDAARNCRDPAIREHGTLYLRRNPHLYRLLNLEAPLELRRPELEIEVDTAEDVQVISAILARLQDRPDFGLADIIAVFDAHPEIAAVNGAVARRWKQYRSEG